ncbi:LysR family transcriptional regulator [Vibrio profundum]|uniref:LysR family transcriptional regulator n=1 Tax=Vibrio profundum TaxID=2910247 RepID=UPI003D0F3E78
MDLTHLQTFLKVAENNSFTGAADAIDVSKGLVSRHVKALEASLNCKLFHRSTRSVTLTESGEALFLKAKKIQVLAREAETQVKDISQAITGDLSITAPLELGKALCQHVIPRFKDSYPEINLRLDFGPHARKVEEGDFDIAIRAGKELPSESVARELGYIRHVLVSSPQYLKGRSFLELENLLTEDFVLYQEATKTTQFDLFNATGNFELTVSGSIRCNSYSGVLELIQQGLGVASLPYYQVEPLIKSGELTHVMPDYSIRAQPLHIVYASHRLTPKKLAMFNQAVMDWLTPETGYVVDERTWRPK